MTIECGVNTIKKLPQSLRLGGFGDKRKWACVQLQGLISGHSASGTGLFFGLGDLERLKHIAGHYSIAPMTNIYHKQCSKHCIIIASQIPVEPKWPTLIILQRRLALNLASYKCKVRHGMES